MKTLIMSVLAQMVPHRNQANEEQKSFPLLQMLTIQYSTQMYSQTELYWKCNHLRGDWYNFFALRKKMSMQKFSYHGLLKIIQKSTHDTATSSYTQLLLCNSEVTTCIICILKVKSNEFISQHISQSAVLIDPEDDGSYASLKV